MPLPRRLKPLSLLALVAGPFFPAPAGAAAVSSPWGVSSSSSGAKDIGEWLPKMKEAGVTSVRLFPEWRSVEPRKGEWNWQRSDALVRAAGDNQIELTAILMGSVPWGGEKVHTFPLADLEGWGGFVGQSVAHYQGRVHRWEVWNEGNGGFNDGHHTAADYATLAATAYAAAKKADPAALVGLSVASFDPAYLHQALLARKAAGTPLGFDYLCLHPYELADNVDAPGGEIPYLWMTRLLRDLLKQSAPEKAGAEVWITEIGRNIARRPDQPAAEREAAAALVKLYVMALAQGIRGVQWFEGRDPAGEEPGFGLLKRDGSPRATYLAFANMTKALGPSPRYLGWVALGAGGRDFGFVFQGPAGPVLAAWKAAGGAGQPPATTVTGGNHETHTLDGTPVFVESPAAALVEEAAANRDRPFPWGGDYSKARRVEFSAASAAPGGVFLAGKPTQPKVTFPDGTSGLLLGANEAANFHVHPSFASILTREYEVRVTVRRVMPGNVGMNLHHEVADSQGRNPYRNVGVWFALGNGDGWQTHTWHVKEACFAKMWGRDFSFVPEQSQPFVLGKVEVSTEPF